MSKRNDEIFAKFMLKLSKKIFDRHNESEELAQQKSYEFNQMLAAFSPNGSALNVYSGILQYPADYSTLFNPLTANDLEVIVAYHNGEDVLMTILSQTR